MNRKQIETHFGATWVDFMAPFVESKEFDNILAALKTIKAGDGTTPVNVFPEAANVFRAFRETPLDTLRVVIVGQDPYPKAGYSTGLAFGIPKDMTPIPPSLVKIIDGVETDCYSGLNFDKANFDVTLESWAKQGVLLLNSALTVKEGEPGTHTELWAPFMKFFFDRLNVICRDIVVCPWGSIANDTCKEVLVFNHFLQPKCDHPSAAARNKEAWKCTHFSAVNAIIVAHRKGDKIVW